MIHPTAIIEGNVKFTHGDDSVQIGPYAILRGDITLGKNCKVEPFACIEGTVTIGNHCSIGHHALIGGLPQDLSFDPATVSGVRIGHHNTLREQVTIHRSTAEGGWTTLGNHNFLMAASHVAHDVTIGDHNIFANAVLLAGHIEVGNHTFLGGGSVFHQFLKIGDYAMAQGLASMSQDVPPFTIASGLNQLAGLNSVGLRRAGFSPEVRKAIKDAYRLVVREGAPIKMIEKIHRTTAAPEALQFLEAFLFPGRKGACRSPLA